MTNDSKEKYWFDIETSEISKEMKSKTCETKSMIKFLLFLIPFSLIAYSLQDEIICPHCDNTIHIQAYKEVNWRCCKCQYYNSDTSGGDWARDHYCMKCGEKK